MTPPYSPGQTLAWLDIHAEGVRLHQATVIHIESATADSRWLINTDRGDSTVDQTGNSGRVLPMDSEIATELYVRGDGYLIRSTTMDQLHVLEQERQGLDVGLDTDLGDDLDFA